MTPDAVDVAVVGSGFSGSLLAMALARRGRRVALLERGRHPRFAIGESSTPLANLLLEEIADRYDLPAVRPFSKWGTWQRARPDVAAGLKRGFTFCFHRRHERFADDEEHGRQLLVAASPHDEIADTHWYRPGFDLALVQDAAAAGVSYLDEVDIAAVERDGPIQTLSCSRHGGRFTVRARFVVDASGPRGFMHRLRRLGELPLRWLPATQGLYAHFTGVEPAADWIAPAGAPPYPPDAAALHHVFDGGWIWVLRFNNGITSAGAALTDRVAAEIRAVEGEAAWHRLLEMLPSVRDQFAAARVAHPFVYSPRIGFRSAVVHGEGWAMLPSAAGVIDPLLSTGFPLTLLGVARLAEILGDESPESSRAARLDEYARLTQQELDATEQLVGALYAVMDDPEMFKRLSLLYFAAASFSETARRLGRPELAPGFLLCRHPTFAGEMSAVIASIGASIGASSGPRGSDRANLLARIDRAIEPFDVAGLRDRSRRDWYPVRADDLLAASARLEATGAEIERLLERSGFTRATS